VRVANRKIGKAAKIWRRYTASIMALDWSQCPEVTRSPDVMSGAWVFKGTRLTVATIFDNLDDGMTIDEILEQFPSATRKQVHAVLAFASHSLETAALAS
jgi:uncharacterized protein (DUF433 family)